MEIREAISALACKVRAKALPAHQLPFAESLLKNAHRLSEKQAYWVRKLAAGKAERATVELGSFEGIAELFGRVASRLKHPSIQLAVFDQRVSVKMAGGRSRYVGQLHITDGARYGENRYFGRIDKVGRFHEGRDVLPGLTDALKDFAAEPARVAAEYGRLTGHCCFCAKQLTDERSTAVGYGETCAGNWGLPWGVKAAHGAPESPQADPMADEPAHHGADFSFEFANMGGR
jgi:hypothetical protein